MFVAVCDNASEIMFQMGMYIAGMYLQFTVLYHVYVVDTGMTYYCVCRTVLLLYCNSCCPVHML